MHLLNKPAGAVLAVVLGWTAAVALLAQAPAQSQDGQAVFRADTRLVVLHASVVDKSGKLLPDLKQDSFKIFENGVEQQLKGFRREDVPVSLGIIIDNSGSMREKRQKVESASLALVRASNPQDEVSIVNFNDEAYLDVPFTNDLKKMEEGVARIDSRGGTAMRDAISMTIDYLKSDGKRDKKVILVVTDGNDNTSNINLERLVKKAQQTEVLVYSIGLLNEEEKHEGRKAKRALDALAVASGGITYYPKETADVEKVALQVAHEIRNQYILTYTPTVQEYDGSYRAIKVTVKGPRAPMVRTRSGYYATPDQANGGKSASTATFASPAAKAPTR